MTTLVTGASGLIGSRLCKKLQESGKRVIGVVHTSSSPMLKSVPTEACDIRDYESIRALVSSYRIETVYHLAAHLPSTTDPDFINVNIAGTSNLLDVCRKKGVRNFIYASSMSVYSVPPSNLPVAETQSTDNGDMYGRTKLIGEHLCKCYSMSMHVAILRFSSVFGVGDKSRVAYHFMHAALLGGPLLVDGDGSQSSDFIYVDDAVRGAMLAAKNGKSGEVYNIGSGRETSVLELANLIAGLVESSVEVRLSGRPATRPFRFVADVSKARSHLKYTPTALVDGLKQYKEEMIASR